MGKGLVSEQAIDTAAERVLASQIRLGLYDPPEASPWAHLGPKVLGSHVELAEEVAAKGAACRHYPKILPLRRACEEAVLPSAKLFEDAAAC